MTIDDFQKLIEKTYFERDNARGVSGTFVWFVEEVGELASAVRKYAEGCPCCGKTPCDCSDKV